MSVGWELPEFPGVAVAVGKTGGYAGGSVEGMHLRIIWSP